MAEHRDRRGRVDGGVVAVNDTQHEPCPDTCAGDSSMHDGWTDRTDQVDQVDHDVPRGPNGNYEEANAALDPFIE